MENIANIGLANKTTSAFKRFSPGSLFAGAIAILAILPADGVGPSFCPSQKLFGLSCPACGLTRSMSSALHFELERSVDYHPLGIVVLLALGSFAFISQSNWERIKSRFEEDELFRKLATGLVVGIFITVWIIRMAYEMLLN